MTEEQERTHLSFSELKTFDECPYRRHLVYALGLRQPPTVHTAFGNAVHEAIDETFGGKKLAWISMGKKITKFIRENPTNEWIKDSNGSLKTLDSRVWTRAAFNIYHQIFDYLETTFPGYKLLGSEVQLMEDMKDLDYKFKGFVDLFIQDAEGVYHVIDFKTCDWGWDMRKKSDTKKKYQIRLYKKFLCEKEGIDPKKVKTHFLLLKRTPSKKSGHFELISVSSGPKAQENVTKWLTKNTKAIKRGLKLKNKLSCKFCKFAKTELCP